MTAEVAIANGHAVALAADSAVTIGGKKIYNSAIKLFSLSKIEPVGIMIYGNSSLLEVPWEIIIKTCRLDIGANGFPTLEEYGDYFINYIKENQNFFSQTSQENWIRFNVSGYYGLIKSELIEKGQSIFSSQGEIDLETTHKILESLINEHHDKLSKMEKVIDDADDFERKIKTKYKDFFKKISNDIFQNISVNNRFTSKLNEIATFLFTRSIFPVGTSGIVIAGYGKKEIFPSVLTYQIEGFLEGKLKYRKLNEKCHKVTGGFDCSITAFAQEDMVAAFMNGINPSVTNLIDAYLDQIFTRLPELLTDDDLRNSKEAAHLVREKLRNNAKLLQKDFQGALQQHITENHVSPVLNMVTALPKDELAAMAESLVSLTAFKRRMTESLETVGGPIDVAVISKGDGLVWVKRKHYFPKELNHQFAMNYFRGVKNE